MRRLLACLACSVAAMSCSTATVQSTGLPGSRRATVAQVIKSSVRVHLLSGKELVRTGSGVVIHVEDASGAAVSYVVTNEHVAETKGVKDPSFEVLVDGRFGAKSHPATVLVEGRVPDQDLAVLAVPGVRLEPATVASDDELEIGADVIAVGAPYGKGLSVSGGMLSQVEVGDGEPTMLKTDAPVGYGASGGGLFDAHSGHLLGIIEGYRTAQVQVPGDTGGAGYTFDVPMPGETFASSIAKVRRFLVDKHVPGAPPTAVAERH